MFGSRKKTNTSGPQPEYNPSSGVFTIPSRMEKLEREKKAARLNITFFAVLFALLFGWMCFYFTQTAIEKKVELFNNDYNKRDELLEARNRRGKIYASDEETLLAETQAELDEDGNVVQTRVYPFGRVFAHALGYSLMGGSGLEEHFKYELLHSNVPLSDKVRCDNKANADERLYPGNDLITTLDPELQQACYDAMGNYRGAVIVTEPSTGKILAMVSKPDFDPNEIEEDWDDLLSDNESGTLLNRVTQGLYPPGSTFKIVDCIDLLSEDPEVADSYSYDCDGVFEEAGETIHCYDYEKHGEIDLKESFAESCNSSFANIGVNVIDPDADVHRTGDHVHDAAPPEHDHERSRERRYFDEAPPCGRALGRERPRSEGVRHGTVRRADVGGSLRFTQGIHARGRHRRHGQIAQGARLRGGRQDRKRGVRQQQELTCVVHGFRALRRSGDLRDGPHRRQGHGFKLCGAGGGADL